MIMLSWMIVGIIVGSIFSFSKPHTSREELVSFLVLGSLGSLAGGFLANSFFATEIGGLNAVSFALSIFGSIALLITGRELKTV